jgi:hypothetical protein
VPNSKAMKGRLMSVPELAWWDEFNKKVRKFGNPDLERQLEKIGESLRLPLKQLENISGYELSEFTATIGVEGSVILLTAKGSVTLKWTKINSSQTC